MLKNSLFNQEFGEKKAIFLIFVSIFFLVYLPLLFKELELRNVQIDKGIPIEQSLPMYGSDSVEYYKLASHLLTNKVFSLSDTKPYVPENFRTIGYPLFLAASLFIKIPISYFPLLQIILTFITAYLIFKIGYRNFSSSRLGIYSSALFLIDPVTIFNTFIVMTDILYIFTFVLFVHVFFDSNNKFGKYILSGIILGISVIVRPISMFLIPIATAFIIYRHYLIRESVKNIFKFIIAFIVSTLFVIAPWIIRNKITSGVYGISTVKSYNVYHYYIPEYIAYKDKIDPVKAREIMVKDIPSFDERSLSNASLMQGIAFTYILKNPFGYGVFHIIKTIPFFLSSGIESFYDSYNAIVGNIVFITNEVNMTNLLMSFNVKEILRVAFENKYVFLEQILLCIFLLLSIYSIYESYKSKDLKKVFLLWFIVLYFALLTGPVSYSRYRLQASPFIFMLVVYSILPKKGIKNEENHKSYGI